jgi:hypothetical protein
MAELVTFDAVWDGTVPQPAEVVASLPGLDAAGTAGIQVVVPPADDGTDTEARVSVDRLAETPGVTSVVTYRPVEVARTLPNLIGLFDLSSGRTDGVTEHLLGNLPNLEVLVTDHVRTEALLATPRLRALSFYPKTHDVPPGAPTAELLGAPGAADRYRIETEGVAILSGLANLERLRIPGFHWRDRADPIAEIAGLRWLHLHGWRNLRALGRLTELERLTLVEAEMTNLRAFRGLTKLRHLGLAGRMTSLDGIEAMTGVETVHLGGRIGSDLTPLTALPNLTDLTMTYTDAVADYAPIGALKRLRRFELLLGSVTDSAALPSIGFLAGLDQLEEVAIRNVRLADPVLSALVELPRLRSVTLTGDAGPNVHELRRRRPDVAVEAHLTGEPRGRGNVGPIHYDAPAEGLAQWRILQDVHDLLGASSNADAERRLRAHLRGTDPDLLARLTFDSESGALGVHASTEADIRAVADALAALAR